MRHVAVMVFALIGLVSLPWLLTPVVKHATEPTGGHHRFTRAVVPMELHKELEIYGNRAYPFHHLGDGIYELFNPIINGWAYTHIRCDDPQISVQAWTHANGDTRVVINHLPDGYDVVAQTDDDGDEIHLGSAR